MQNDAKLVFDEVMEDTHAASATATTYTSLEFSDFLAHAQQMVFFVVTQSLTSVDSVKVQIEIAGDGRSWQKKNTIPEFSKSVIPAGRISNWSGEAWPTKPNLRFVRLRIDVDNKAAPFSVRVKVYVTSRSRRRSSISQAPLVRSEPRQALEMPSGPGGMSESALAEIRQAFSGISMGPTEPAPHAQVLSQLSTGARGEVAALAKRIGAMSARERQTLAAMGAALSRLGDGLDANATKEPCVDCDPARGAD